MNGQRKFAVIVFSLLYASVYPFPQVSQLLELAFTGFPLKTEYLLPGLILLNLAGLLIGGFFIRNIREARRVMLAGAIAFLASQALILFSGGIIVHLITLASSILSGSLLAAFGYYYRACSPRGERMALAGGMIIGYNIIYLFLNILTTLLSLEVRQIVSMAFVFAALVMIWRSGGIKDPEEVRKIQTVRHPQSGFRSLVLLFVFIFAVWVTSVLLNEIVLPEYYRDYPYEAMFYNLPYIATAFLIIQAARRVNLQHTLNLSLAMLGFSLVAVVINNPSHLGLMMANVLLQGGVGIISIIILSIIGDLLSLYQKPSWIFGLGFAANRIAAIAGSMAFSSMSKMNMALAGFVAVLLAIILLPELYRALSRTIENQEIVSIFILKPVEEQVRTIGQLTASKGLTRRENEIVSLLLKGYTYVMIAEELCVTHSTVKTYISNIYSKMGVRSKSDLIQKLAP